MPTPALEHVRSAGSRRQERVKIDTEATGQWHRRQGLVKIPSEEGARVTRFPTWWTHYGVDDRREGSIPE